MIRGRHIDLANWMLRERGIGNVGGAMDLAAGAKRIVVVMEHTTRDGQPKIVRTCSYPLTAPGCVNLIVTDLAVIEVAPAGLLLTEVAPRYTAEDIQAVTEPRLAVALDLKIISL